MFYSEVSVSGAGAVPETGPVLFIGSERNGRVDAWLYRRAIRGLRFLTPPKRRRRWFDRLLYRGRALPEGDLKDTLSLYEEFDDGARYMMFYPGDQAADLALDYARTHRQGAPLVVVPVRVYYEAPAAFRSRAEIVFGDAVTAGDDLGPLRRDIAAASDELGLHPPGARRRFVHRLALLAREADDREPSYLKTFHELEGEIPHDLDRFAALFLRRADAAGAAAYQGIPYYEDESLGRHLFLLLAVALPVAAALLLNLPAAAGGGLAGAFLAETPARRVETKLRWALGLSALWLPALAVAVAVAFPDGRALAAAAAAYLVATRLGIAAYDSFKRLAVGFYNALFFPELRSEFFALRRRLAEFHAFYQ